MRSRVVLLLALSACVEGDAGSETTIDGPRLIAVLSDPAESAPGQKVRFTAVIAGAAQSLSWSFCSTPRAPVDNTSASPSCATTQERAIAGDGPTVDTTIPTDACRIFGSETPAGSATTPADASGGYYQPVRVAFGAQVLVARQRIRCALPAAPVDIAREFAINYRPNLAPTISSLHTLVDGVEQAPDSLPHSDEVELRLAYLPGEPYLLYQSGLGALQTAIERQRVSWFVSVGSISPAQTDGVSYWHVPLNTQSAQLWAVLRDDRGAATSTVGTLAFRP